MLPTTKLVTQQAQALLLAQTLQRWQRRRTSLRDRDGLVEEPDSELEAGLSSAALCSLRMGHWHGLAVARAVKAVATQAADAASDSSCRVD